MSMKSLRSLMEEVVNESVLSEAAQSSDQKKVLNQLKSMGVSKAYVDDDYVVIDNVRDISALAKKMGMKLDVDGEGLEDFSDKEISVPGVGKLTINVPSRGPARLTIRVE